ncbi:hypothetical protein NEIELOOT_00062 [Neisseria elongata subsp. glycolytica ATCC 29315]|uniref:Uncharacterized protein n=1 Tax=Neisseria elongata subsp. glycolytica ATCC 29315 TaxID=546263 RepID=D4DM02_NEIEG|nr:hypothetical protein NEIELOOT_00062 [Neisseria elongata subsp. glycolytica ATCC 29315]
MHGLLPLNQYIRPSEKPFSDGLFYSFTLRLHSSNFPLIRIRFNNTHRNNIHQPKGKHHEKIPHYRRHRPVCRFCFGQRLHRTSDLQRQKLRTKPC